MRLAFYLTTYKDEGLLPRCLGQIRTYYPEAELVVIADGPAHPAAAKWVAEAGGIFVERPRLKLPATGGHFSQHTLCTVLHHTTAPLLVKLDPDSYLARRFKPLPEVPWLAKTRTFRVFDTDLLFGLGCCWVLRRETAETLVESGLLLTLLRERGYQSVRRRGGEVLYCEDPAVSYCLRELGVLPTEWSEVTHTESLPVAGALPPYAVYHGNKRRGRVPL